jgi:hypothetical protein
VPELKNHANLMIAHFHSLSFTFHPPIASFTHIGDERTGIRGGQTRAQIHGDFGDNLGIEEYIDLISYSETEI